MSSQAKRYLCATLLALLPSIVVIDRGAAWAGQGHVGEGAEADLSITKTDGVVAVTPPSMGGSAFGTYVIVVSNGGPSDAPGTVVTDNFSTACTVVSYSSVAAGGATGNTPTGNFAINDTLNMPVGSSVTYTASCLRFVFPGMTSVVNTATVAAGAGVTDPNPDNNSATDVNAVGAADVFGAMTVSGDFYSGGTVTYTVVLANEGVAPQGDNLDSEFWVTLPEQLQLVSFSADGGAASNTNPNTVSWNGALAPNGGTVTITITGTVLPGNEGETVSNQGGVRYDSNNSGTNNALRPTDDPAQSGDADPTTFVVGTGFEPGIPTLSGAASLLLIGLFAGLGVVVLRRSRRGRGTVWTVVFVALALGMAGARQAAARDLTLTVTPETATWRDRVMLRASGEVETACGPSIMRFANVRKPSDLGPSPVIEVDLVEDPCLLPTLPRTEPFTAEVDLGHVPPGNGTLFVHDVADGSLVQRELLIYDVSRLGLEGPRTAAVEGQPVKVAVTYYDDCSHLSSNVDGKVITISYAEGCIVEPLGPPQHTRTELDVGVLAAGEYELRLIEPFATFTPGIRRLPLRVWPSGGCAPSDFALCLHDGRFRLTGTWRAFDGTTGAAHAAPLPGNEGSGLFWFFGPENAELTVKLLNGCPVDGDWWVFLASSSTVEYTLTVTDTRTGATRQYVNALGQVPDLIADTDAFDCP